jgi:CDP-2,3-bis-(O-geranylgeranyl)-sn-glycerol synthase
MHILSLLQAMALLALANGTPVIAKRILGQSFARPLDGGLRFFDGRPLFGASKTIRGIGLDMGVGGTAAAAAMVGDLGSSFVKRRLKFPPSSQALGLDQVPESLLPLLACRAALSLSVADIALGVAVFLVGEIVLSRILHRAHLRDEPY